MNSRLDLDLSIRATVPGPRTPQAEAAAARRDARAPGLAGAVMTTLPGTLKRPGQRA